MQNWAECNSIYNRHSQQFLVEDKVRAGYPSRRTPRDPVRALIWQDTSLMTQATPLNGRERGCIRFQKFSFIRCSVCYSSNSNDEMSIFLLRITCAIEGSNYSMKLGNHLLKYNQVNLDGRRKINLHWRVKICKKKKRFMWIWKQPDFNVWFYNKLHTLPYSWRTNKSCWNNLKIQIYLLFR